MKVISKIYILMLTISILCIALSVNAKEKKNNFWSWISLYVNAKESNNGLESPTRKKLNLLITLSMKDAKGLYLTEERIQTKCELRLREAGINPDEKFLGEYLAINIDVFKMVYVISIEFLRPVLFSVGETVYKQEIVPTWRTENFGTHGNDPEFIIQSLDSLLDKFLNEYLKVNPK